MVLSIYVDLLVRKRLKGGWASSRLVAGINRAAASLDRRSPELREPRPGALFANLHVVAEAPS
jgi:hypothetical protein